MGERAPRLVVDRAADDVPRIHVGEECIEVVAHQIELVHVVFLRWMHGHLGGRQPEDEPSLANVDGGESQDIAEKRAIAFGVLAIENRVRTDDHEWPLPGLQSYSVSWQCSTNPSSR